MMKIWQMFLSSILVASTTVTVTEVADVLATDGFSLTQSNNYVYRNINQSFVDYYADVKQQNVGSNGTRTGAKGTVLKWSTYAKSWDEFKENYVTLNLRINMDIAFNWYNVQWSTSSLDISSSAITTATGNWVAIRQVDHTTTQGGRWDATHAKLSYAVWRDAASINIKFKLVSWASNNYDNYYFSIDTRTVVANANNDFSKIKQKFEQNVNNQTLSLESDYSTSLLEEHNKLLIKDAVDKLIKDALGQYYETWKPFIQPYSYHDDTSQASVVIRFNDVKTNKVIQWNFNVTIKFTLSADYWSKTMEKRLHITPGKVVDPKDPQGEIVDDVPLKWNDKDVYSTKASIVFDAAPDGSETLKINGVPIQVIDNKFTFDMTDNQENKTNEYKILLEKHDLNDFNKIISKYERIYLIKQTVPPLDLGWYAWDPENNPDQKRLIDPMLPGGTPNPAYDREVNPKTGTKKQIVWLNQKAQNPFPLDPVDANGKLISDGSYQEGFLAEGSVSGMGITQIFSDPWIKRVERVKVDEKTLTPTGIVEAIKSDKDGSYFSLSGTYLYIITDQKDQSAYKFIIIGQKWQNKYAKFLDVLDNSSLAVSFWDTMQGFHLKSYLAQYKMLNSTDVLNLTFEEVSSYWREYVSDIKSGRIDPGGVTGDRVMLTGMKIDDVKTNSSDINVLRSEILTTVKKKLNDYQLIYNVDYEIVGLEPALIKLAEYDEDHDVTVDLTVQALPTSVRAQGSTMFAVRNSKNYDANKVVDLSKIKFENPYLTYNFSQKTPEELRKWIVQAIDKKFRSLNINQLTYAVDYQIAPFDDATLNEFIHSKDVASLELTISAVLESNLAVNSTTVVFVNDPDGEIAPPEPPDPKPDPDPNPNPLPHDGSGWTKKENLILLSVMVVLIIGTASGLLFIKYRMKKGIGGKKLKTEQKNESKKQSG